MKRGWGNSHHGFIRLTISSIFSRISSDRRRASGERGEEEEEAGKEGKRGRKGREGKRRMCVDRQ